jgi:hypothetical protein
MLLAHVGVFASYYRHEGELQLATAPCHDLPAAARSRSGPTQLDLILTGVFQNIAALDVQPRPLQALGACAIVGAPDIEK